MRLCTKCEVPKDEGDFYKNKAVSDGLCRRCKSCMNELRRQWSSQNREKTRLYGRRRYYKVREQKLAAHRKWAVKNRDKIRANSKRYRERNKEAWLVILREEFGSICCDECGYDKCFEALDFHHLDPNKKEHSFGNLIHLKPTDNRIKELEKGILLCATCHREKHWG